MRALTLYQPWASLIALGVKTIETRSWKPPSSAVGQRLLIHAAKRVPTPERGPLFVGDFHVAQNGTWLHGRQFDLRMPLGAIVGSCELVDVVPMVDLESGEGIPHEGGSPLLYLYPDGQLILSHHFEVPVRSIDVTDQLPYGDFTPGRWAYLLEDAKRTDERCPACWGWGTTAPIEAQVSGVFRASPFGPGTGVPACPTCHGKGSCPPIPAKGKQGCWRWEPEVECIPAVAS